MTTVTPAPTLLLTVEEAAEQIRCGRDRIFDLIRDGQLPSKKIGARRLIAYTALVEYVKNLPDEPLSPA